MIHYVKVAARQTGEIARDADGRQDLIDIFYAAVENQTGAYVETAYLDNAFGFRAVGKLTVAGKEYLVYEEEDFVEIYEAV